MRLAIHIYCDKTQEEGKPSDVMIANSLQAPITNLHAGNLQLRFKWRGSRPLLPTEQDPPSSIKVSGLPARQWDPDLLRKHRPFML